MNVKEYILRCDPEMMLTDYLRCYEHTHDRMPAYTQ